MMNRICVILLSVWCLTSCSNKAEKEAVVQTVKIDTVVAAGGKTALQYPGKVKAAQDISLAFRVSGTIERVLVDEGTRISKGQLLAE